MKCQTLVEHTIAYNNVKNCSWNFPFDLCISPSTNQILVYKSLYVIRRRKDFHQSLHILLCLSKNSSLFMVVLQVDHGIWNCVFLFIHDSSTHIQKKKKKKKLGVAHSTMWTTYIHWSYWQQFSFIVACRINGLTVYAWLYICSGEPNKQKTRKSNKKISEKSERTQVERISMWMLFWQIQSTT